MGDFWPGILCTFGRKFTTRRKFFDRLKLKERGTILPAAASPMIYGMPVRRLKRIYSQKQRKSCKNIKPFRERNLTLGIDQWTANISIRINVARIKATAYVSRKKHIYSAVCKFITWCLFDWENLTPGFFHPCRPQSRRSCIMEVVIVELRGPRLSVAMFNLRLFVPIIH